MHYVPAFYISCTECRAYLITMTIVTCLLLMPVVTESCVYSCAAHGVVWFAVYSAGAVSNA